ncbi:hypothetical protein DIS24_g10877 [Lasiodiplodia hormozganensis]|uniref:Uncharacterized protein n=1 Tax=Lasiodiplodia hormozganensis TaxID=869390 RepID=A0AA39X658_9PEZI|nr:hypothetical protein DIS24_g10877 [Lasiodiplodia hormozganensis]
MLAASTSEAMRRLREADAGEGEGVLEANEEISVVEAVEAAARAGDAGMVGFACTKRSWNQISRVFHAIMDGGYASFMMLSRAVTDVIGEYEDGDLNNFMILAIIKNDAGEVVGRLELIKSSDNGAYLVHEDSANSLITLFESNSAPKVVFVGLIDGEANVLSVVYLPNEDKVQGVQDPTLRALHAVSWLLSSLADICLLALPVAVWRCLAPGSRRFWSLGDGVQKKENGVVAVEIGRKMVIDLEFVVMIVYVFLLQCCHSPPPPTTTR